MRETPGAPGTCKRLSEMSRPSAEQNRQGVDYFETAGVQNLHAAVQLERRAARVTIKPFSLWMLVLWGVVFFFAGFFATRHGNDFSATNLNRGDSPPAQSTPQAVQTSTASAGAVQAAVADANEPVVVHVAAKNMKFSPATIEIKKGDTVEWKNDDITPHTATGATFDSGTIAPEAAWRHTFTETGSISYICTFHPDMKGSVTVK